MSDRFEAARGRNSSEGDRMNAILAQDLASGMEPALARARHDMRRLEKALHRGVGDRDHAVRARVAKESGVPESYLLRLHKRAREMTDVSGKFARLLALAADRLDQQTERAKARREEADREVLAIRDELAGGGSCGGSGRAAAIFHEATAHQASRAPAPTRGDA